jgi:Tfp pilus assembly protein PilW
MTRPAQTAAKRRETGVTLVELMVGLVLGLLVVAGLTALLSATLAARERAGRGVERLAATTAALDQLARDIRLAGYDPQARGIGGVTTASIASVSLDADLDGDGTIDTTSEEHVTYRVAASSGTLQRVVGAQSLPLLSDVGTGSFILHYLDGVGAELDPLAPTTRSAVRMIWAELRVAAVGTLPEIRLAGGARLLNR